MIATRLKPSWPTLPRAETKARHQLDRDLARAVRQAVKGTGWRASQGVVFQRVDEWFVAASPSVHVNAYRTSARFEAKPLNVDPAFWKIIGSNLETQPLSFRLFGAFTLPPLTFVETELNELGGAEAIAARLVDWADDQSRQMPSLSSFLVQVERSARECPGHKFSALHAVNLIMSGREAEALNYVKEQRVHEPLGGGYLFLEEDQMVSFYDKCESWLTNRDRHQAVH